MPFIAIFMGFNTMEKTLVIFTGAFASKLQETASSGMLCESSKDIWNADSIFFTNCHCHVADATSSILFIFSGAIYPWVSFKKGKEDMKIKILTY